VIVVGGPQYRIGSHRYFVLLARKLCAKGYPVLRFDYRGMGDSDGEPVGFEGCGPDIRAAVDCLAHEQPQLRGVVLWGLCDGASAAMMYAATDDRVCGIIALNPWARSDDSLARTHLRHYYIRRLFEREFWLTTMRDRARIAAALRGLVNALGRVVGSKEPPSSSSGAPIGPAVTDFRERMRLGIETFRRPVLFLISGSDITGAEFRDLMDSQRRWSQAVRRCPCTMEVIPNADHTLSGAAHQEVADAATIRWLAQFDPGVVTAMNGANLTPNRA
jgi:exosortase A-associated hydrolase 1